jgi:hypothetical protein
VTRWAEHQLITSDRKLVFFVCRQRHSGTLTTNRLCIYCQFLAPGADTSSDRELSCSAWAGSAPTAISKRRR